MVSNYEDIYSKFLGLINEYDFLSMSQSEAYELMSEYLNQTFSRPKVRKLFSSISWDDLVQKVDYTFVNSNGDQFDKAFFENLAANGMVVAWLTPQAQNNQLIINQMFGTKETNFYSQSNHATAIEKLITSAKKELDKTYIRDSGYANFVMNR